MDCYKKSDNVCFRTIMSILMAVLLIWNIFLTIADNGNDSNSSECFCVEQMRNVIEQITRLYPTNELFITLDGGDATVGLSGQIILGPNGSSGVLELLNEQGAVTQYVSICSIDTITVNNATYNEQITFLPEPNPAPTDCLADCDSAYRDLLPVGTTGVNIITSTQLQSIGNVVVNVPGMIVLENTENNNITFISSCRIDNVLI